MWERERKVIGNIGWIEGNKRDANADKSQREHKGVLIAPIVCTFPLFLCHTLWSHLCFKCDMWSTDESAFHLHSSTGVNRRLCRLVNIWFFLLIEWAKGTRKLLQSDKFILHTIIPKFFRKITNGVQQRQLWETEVKTVFKIIWIQRCWQVYENIDRNGCF